MKKTYWDKKQEAFAAAKLPGARPWLLPYHPKFAPYFWHFISYQYEDTVLENWEIVPWLELHFADLPDAEDYAYLANIISAYSGQHSFVPTSREGIALLWLRQHISRLGGLPTVEVAAPLPVTKPSLHWLGSKAELAELGYALLEAGLVEGNRGSTITTLGEVFGVELGKPEKHLQTIQKRKAGVSLTPLLDRLKSALERFLGRA